MNARAYRLDAEHQTADANRADRDERHAAARFDRRDLVRLGGRWIEADRVPHPSDVEWGDA